MIEIYILFDGPDGQLDYDSAIGAIQGTIGVHYQSEDDFGITITADDQSAYDRYCRLYGEYLSSKLPVR